MKKILFTLLLSSSSLLGIAQKKVITQGAITFEKKVNMHKSMEGNGNSNNEWVQEMKKRMPKYQVSNFDLLFKDNVSLYKKSKEQPSQDLKRMGMMRIEDDKNETYKDLDSNTLIATKQVFEQLSLVKDSLIVPEWKFSNQYRMIADYNCRRATTILFDSMYVIAFYTDAISTQSGPEGFNGLPGMILGVVIPRLNVTYFATKVEDTKDVSSELKIPTKGKKTNYKELASMLIEATKGWGRWGANSQQLLWSYLY